MFGCSLNLHVHFHTIATDGVFEKTDAGGMRFHEAPPLPRRTHARCARSPSRKTTCRCGLSRMSPDVRCTTFTAPLLTAPHAPRRAPRSS
ncbi:transposase [Sorangium sp. So ce321]|uniref:hypothetical protein n=1 Tax=Sorangium sp. So ce321 TaxID=3133300 RepID=UPI003F6332EC